MEHAKFKTSRDNYQSSNISQRKYRLCASCNNIVRGNQEYQDSPFSSIVILLFKNKEDEAERENSVGENQPSFSKTKGTKTI